MLRKLFDELDGQAQSFNRGDGRLLKADLDRVFRTALLIVLPVRPQAR